MSAIYDKALSLLSDPGLTPGPWEAYDPGDGTARLYGDMETCPCPDVDEDARGVRLFHRVGGSVPAEAMAYMSRPDGELAAAAPLLASEVIRVHDRIREKIAVIEDELSVLHGSTSLATISRREFLRAEAAWLRQVLG